MEVYEFPVGVVVLDIDAPTRHFWDGEMGAKAMETDVRYGLATALSERWQLGRFWMYRTKSGLHVVFERVLVQRSDVRDVMADANAQVGWKLCGGFFCMHADKDRLTLRVGVKKDRPYDIRPLDEVGDDAPWFVREHHEAVLRGGVS